MIKTWPDKDVQSARGAGPKERQNSQGGSPRTCRVPDGKLGERALWATEARSAITGD